jgi:hypothetical protein
MIRPSLVGYRKDKLSWSTDIDRDVSIVIGNHADISHLVRGAGNANDCI